jgi:hypothetical protein
MPQSVEDHAEGRDTPDGINEPLGGALTGFLTWILPKPPDSYESPRFFRIAESLNRGMPLSQPETT